MFGSVGWSVSMLLRGYPRVVRPMKVPTCVQVDGRTDDWWTDAIKRIIS